MTQKFDIRQSISRDVLDQIAAHVANKEVDDLLRSIDSELMPPLALRASNPASLVATIGNITVANPEQLRNRTIPPISNLLPSFTSGTVTLSATGAGSATPSVGSAVSLGMSASQFMKLGVNLDATGSLTLTKGTPGASLAAATTPPTVSGLFAIGFIVVRTDGSNNVQNVLNSDIYQYVGGGGGGSGTGNGNTILETLKNELVDSPYQLVTPNVIVTDAATKFSSITGAAYDLISSTIKFTANGQVATSIQLLDSVEFLASSLDVTAIDLSVFWSRGTTLTTLNIPPAFTYEVSRDGGTNWFTMTMARIGTTEAFRGALRFDTSTTTESVKQTIASHSAGAVNNQFNTTTAQKIAQSVTISTGTVIQDVQIKFHKIGSPTGNIYVSLVRDAASPGSPSLLTSDILCESSAVTVASLTSDAFNTISLPKTVLSAGTYWILVRTDAAYQASFSNGVTELDWITDAGSVSPSASQYNGTTWSSLGRQSQYILEGRALDLRVRITSAGSPTYPAGLDGFGIFYNLQDVGIVGTTKKTQRFVFNSTIDNSNTFTITAFSPDPDLLNCYYVEGGQVFKSPAFSVAGNVVTFPANTFNNGGVSSTVTLIFDQNAGGAFDNSDSNRRLLAANHLGSTNGADDTSAAGRGILLRNGAGTLMELALDTDGLPIVLSVP